MLITIIFDADQPKSRWQAPVAERVEQGRRRKLPGERTQRTEKYEMDKWAIGPGSRGLRKDRPKIGRERAFDHC